MRSSASSHLLSYRTKEGSLPGGSECLTFNCKLLLNLLHAMLDEKSLDAESSIATGQKRPRTLSHTFPRKRRDLVTGTIDVPCPPAYESIPVLRHEFNLQYSKQCQDVRPYALVISDNEAGEDGLTSLEQALVGFLRNSCASPTEPTTLHCGDVLINSYGEHGGTVDAKPSHLEEQWADLRNIFFIPALHAEGMERGDGHLFSWVDAHTRSTSHQSAIEVTACLRIVVFPLTSWDETFHTLPFRLVVDFDLSFRPPTIFYPLAKLRNSQNRTEIETARRGLLHLAFPRSPLPETSSSSFQGRIDVPFLYAVVQPARAVLHDSVDKLLQPQALVPRLLPFQKRTVAWMLSREGKSFEPSGELRPTVADPAEVPLLWQPVTVQRDDEQLTWYYHRLTGTLTPERPDSRTVMGGILAEEPGLGKTVECIALIFLNPGIGRSLSHVRWDPEARMSIREIRTTLIVTPSSLSQQWIDELAQHAPTLNVLVYSGWKNISIGQKMKSKSKQEEKGTGKAKAVDVIVSDDANPSLFDCWPAYINDFHVCITTYDTLRQDLNVARAPPARPARQTVQYSRDQRPISPLVMCEWYRVIMDEVQMVGGGKASEMVSLIPRLSSFAVSGTPARTRISDLFCVLKFLRVDPSIYAPKNWNRLIHPNYAAEFSTVFQQYTVRTMKSAVQAELTIPAQTRYVFPIYLGKVERHVYDESLEKALSQLSLDARGVVISPNGEVDTAILRAWLRKLRQICTHPQVGKLQKPGDKSYKAGVLKTMREVLEGMKDQNWRNIMDDRRSKINEMATATQIMQHDGGIYQRAQNCLEILLRAEKEAEEIISDVVSVITDHDAKGAELKAKSTSRRMAIGVERHVDDDDPTLSGNSDDNTSDDGGLPKTPAGEEHLHKSRALQQRLRDCYLTLHRVKFLQGDMYHWMGESRVAEEATAYKAADEIRSKLLKFTGESAVRAMAQLRADVGKKGLIEKGILVRMPYCPRGGILSAHLLLEADQLIDRVLNEQSRLLWKWRTRIHSLLTRSLTSSDDEGEADGQEYSRTLDTQGEAETYLHAYAMLLADRREVLTAERTMLAVHDARERKGRKTAAAAKATALRLDEPDPGLVTVNIELQPEHGVLKEELMNTRKSLLMLSGGRAVKSIVIELTAVVARIRENDDWEKVLAKEGVSSLRRLMSAQAIINEQIEADLALFRKAFNERILYFRQLQEISDSVGEAQRHDVDDVGLALQRNHLAQAELERRIITGRARQRYLTHLSEERTSQDDGDECCILCRVGFLSGYITQCAHVFCENCLKTWLLRHGKACPVCRFPINVDALQHFSIQKTDKDKAAQPAEKLQSDPIMRSRRKIEYNTVSPGLRADIDTMELCGSYGTKIDTLVRHLLYLQIADVGAKSIVFSAWEDSLHIIEHALINNGIPSLRIDSGNRKQDAATRFRNDPTILALLLHGERQNAGLNVTCASRVFLLESVVHHSFEVQAIARIDRLGQLRPTEVYCYYAEDTVERNILDLAVRQGLSLYTADRARGTVDTTALVTEVENPIVDAPAKKEQKGDFIFRLDDMMSILFPHLCEDVEFLLPPEEVGMREVPAADASNDAPSFATSPSRSSSRRVYETAVAGPSRLG
ncbi:SNF2 family N-terminal domain-containing protein [Russula earlei]|uniref:SNF2 family N-terminal domain-containing protein n=1 Tax=Russula earlei TaxID=71964 RepID=A0ACC0UFS0_9AGAM|nr:SNF2 family N-terminal domain-containing protein [Russula earlei]